MALDRPLVKCASHVEGVKETLKLVNWLESRLFVLLILLRCIQSIPAQHSAASLTTTTAILMFTAILILLVYASTSPDPFHCQVAQDSTHSPVVLSIFTSSSSSVSSGTVYLSLFFHISAT